MTPREVSVLLDSEAKRPVALLCFAWQFECWRYHNCCVCVRVLVLCQAYRFRPPLDSPYFSKPAFHDKLFRTRSLSCCSTCYPALLIFHLSTCLTFFYPATPPSPLRFSFHFTFFHRFIFQLSLCPNHRFCLYMQYPLFRN